MAELDGARLHDERWSVVARWLRRLVEDAGHALERAEPRLDLEIAAADPLHRLVREPERDEERCELAERHPPGQYLVAAVRDDRRRRERQHHLAHRTARGHQRRTERRIA